MTSLMLERSHFEIGKAPVADFAAGGTVSDVVSLKRHNRVRFIVFWGVGTTGTITLTVLACDDVVPSNTTAVPFWYQINNAGVQGDVTYQGTPATGVVNIAGSNQIMVVETTAALIGAAAAGRSYAQLNVAETTNDPLLGGILVELLEPRHADGDPQSALT